MLEDNEIKLDDEENEDILLNDKILEKEEETINIIAKKYNNDEKISKDTIMVSRFDEKSGHIIY